MGVEFADYEKGLDTVRSSLIHLYVPSLLEWRRRRAITERYILPLQCHLRFSSSHLASLMLTHFTCTPSLHLSPTYISSSLSTSTPPIDVPAIDPSRRPIVAQLLEGTREIDYWRHLPEATRRGARKSAGGPVALVKSGSKRKAEEVEAEKSEGAEEVKTEQKEKEESEPVVARPRKKPTKL